VTVANVSLKDIHKILPKLTTAEQEQLLAELDKLDKLKTRALSRKRFLKFVEEVWPSFIGGRHHAKMADAFERVARGELKRLIINMPPRHRLDIREQIPTTQGWKTVETVEVGDYVFAPDGAPVQVTGKSAEYDEEIYEVTTSDGQVVRCDATHLWTVRFGSNDRPYQTLSTQEILHKLETESWRRAGNLPILPPQGAAEYPHKDNLPLTPYMLGVWLGDGSSYNATVGCGYSDQSAMRAQVEAEGYKTTHNSKYQQFNVLGLYKPLREQGLLRDKHIPEAYLCASVAQRMSLLQGLIDTDGDVTEEGKVTFNNSNERLIDDVLCLLHGLGVQARKTRRQTGYKGKPSQPSFRVMFKLANAARLPRKAVRCRDKQGNWGRSIDIRKTAERGTVQCLEVANEDGLFMAGRGWVVTHNTKSEFASYLLPAWFLGQFPHKKVIQCSHTAELAVGFGRKVRNLVDTETFHEIFPDLTLSADSKAAGRWNTSKGGDYFAIGVGGAVTGKGADVLIIDDPHSEQEAALAEINPDIYDKTYEWYTSGPRQRLQPGGAIIVVMCMVGDTDVLMADGTQKKLRDVRPGDWVAAYEGGHMAAARVTNFRSSGVDNVFTVKTQSGRVIRANEDHPFLMEHNGERKWARLKHLTVSMSLVGTKGVSGPLGLSPIRDSAIPAKPESLTGESTPERHRNPWATMVSGRVKSAPVADPFIRAACASATTGSSIPLRPLLLSSAGRGASSTAMVSPCRSITLWWPNVETGVTFAGSLRLLPTLARIGLASCVLTIATALERFAASCATTATLLWDTVKRRIRSFGLRSTYEFEADPIVEITPAGREEVFDVEIAHTENFIASGLVSHNTRWSKRDLTGQVLKAAAQRGGDEWEVIEFPAILPSGNSLWPEFWSLKELSALREELPNSKWQAQYQQAPTSDNAAIVKREWWKTWEKGSPPHCEFTLMAWDTAFEKTQRADYSACTTWGVFYHPDDNGIEQANIILLNAFRDRMEFPTLKRVAVQEYREWEPDSIIIEKKASGAPLIYEMRAMGIPVQEFTPSRGNDKISRLNAVSDLFASGRVWAPNTQWAEEVIDEVASFPGGEHDDYVDSVSLALHRFRKGGYVTTSLDADDEPVYFKSHRQQGYY